jgi:hypothetical protein
MKGVVGGSAESGGVCKEQREGKAEGEVTMSEY